jgi:hypothetical protein
MSSAILLKRTGQAGAVVGAIVVLGVSVFGREPAPPAAFVQTAERETRAFLDERAAAHLRRLRESH